MSFHSWITWTANRNQSEAQKKKKRNEYNRYYNARLKAALRQLPELREKYPFVFKDLENKKVI